MRKVNVGVIGCGVISQTYLRNLTASKWINVAACADMYYDKAQSTAQAYGVPKACAVQELLDDPEIEIIVNLTIPAAHYEINMAALNTGKHVYCEKPLALNVEDAKLTLDLAKAKGLMVGCAPDTILGPALQTCRKIIDEGWIGEPVAATANFVCGGHETWHPAPEFYYKPGGSPVMDMGPYYVSALVALLGPVSKVSCFAKRTFPKRTILSQPQAGKQIDVEVNTHYSGLLEFHTGLIASVNFSSDIWLSNLPVMEIYGSAGALIVPDPNFFSGEIKLLRGESMVDSIQGLPMGEAVEKIHSEEMYDFFKVVPQPYHCEQGNLRGLGVVDMARAMVEKRCHRASGELAYHVTEVITSFDKSSLEDKVYAIESTCERPERMPEGKGIGEVKD